MLLFRYLLRFAPDDPASQNIRVQALFERLGLEDRVVTEKSDAVQVNMKHRSVQEKLAQFREKSLRYLQIGLAQEGMP